MIRNVKAKFQRKWMERDIIKERLKEKKQEKIQNKVRLESLEKAQVVIQELAKQVQEKIEFKISNLVTLALHTVDESFPEFVVKFVSKRGQTECDLLFKEEGQEQKPLGSSGEGAIDIAALALRIAIWNLKPNRACMILDEPTRSLSEDKQENAGKMIKMLSEKLGMQFIIVSHKEDINKYADKSFVVTKKKGISYLKEKN